MSPSPATIFALSSGRPPAAIAVIRISGPRAGDALTALGVKIPPPRKAGLARIRDPQSGELIDEALVLWFPGPNSETGEDTAELQAHGGRAVIAAILAALGKIEGLRMAEPGEFTRRGFENGKLDLTAVEGLADLVGAETEAQRRQAFRQMKGALGDRAEDWRQRLIRALALVEARIDFSDEGDVPEDLVTPALKLVRELADEIEAVLADGGRGERLREGLVAAIAGPPNAGKSTLLNRIARREAAIVSPYAGTTRDVIEVHLDLGGFPVTLLDTAGIRETGDPVEMEGVRRARERSAAADLVLWVADARERDVSATPAQGFLKEGLPGVVERGASASERSEPAQSSTPPIWVVWNKCDLLSDMTGRNESYGTKSELEIQKDARICSTEIDASRKDFSDCCKNDIGFIVSASEGQGVDTILSALTGYAEIWFDNAEPALITRERHRRALEEAQEALRRALRLPAEREDFLAEELRIAASALSRLTGRVDVEDVLDVIFRDFCIGK